MGRKVFSFRRYSYLRILQRVFCKRKLVTRVVNEGKNSPFSGNDVDLMTGNKIPFCTSSSLLARTEIFLSSAAIGKNNPLVNNLIYRLKLDFVYLTVKNVFFSFSFFFKSIIRIEEKGKITHTMRQPRIYPISFSVSTSRV